MTSIKFAYSELGGDMVAQSGGAAAIRGFRLQTFYILKRLLESKDDLFQPENAEDLLRLSTDGLPQEHIQIKAYAGPLTVSMLATSNSDGANAEPAYFRRVLARLSGGDARETLVAVGQFGAQMWKGWNGDLNEQTKIRRTLKGKQYSDDEIDLLLSALNLEQVNEQEQDQQIAAFLQEGITAGDVGTARSALAWWLLELSEQSGTGPQNAVSLFDVQRKLQEIGRSTTELKSFHDEWGRTLVPLLPDSLSIDNPDVLRQELFNGVGARLEHILADVDVRRPKQINQLTEAFVSSQLVILRGASGQGKSALAFRFLHDTGQLPLTYQVKRVRDVTQAQNIAQAINAFLRQHPAELYLLIDVYPGDREWLELLTILRGTRQLRILVTIRQEDWTKGQAQLEQLSPAVIPLKFDEEEAVPLFKGLQKVRPSAEFMRFEEAWNAFRQEGPLLEFVYMLTHEGQQLQARLQQQLEAVQQEWQAHPNYLEFLHAVAFATAAGAWVNAKSLARSHNISNPELVRIIQRLSEEHLLREEGGVIRGLHAIRSNLLAQLLSDPDFMPASNAFQQVLAHVLERDLELLVLDAFIRLSAEQVLPALHSAQPKTWLGLTGITRVLIWYSISQYVRDAQPAIQDAFDEYGFGWQLLVSPDLMNLRARGLVPQYPDWDELSFPSQTWKAKIKQRRAAFMTSSLSFQLVGDWLTGQQQQLLPPGDVNDWLAAAEMGFYSSFWHFPAQHYDTLDLHTLQELPLREAAEVYYGVSFVENALLADQLPAVRTSLTARFRVEGDIKLLQEEDKSVTIHFIIPVEDTLNPLPGDNPIHEATIARLDILHHLYPEKEVFASQGYGHLNPLLPVEFHVDDTHKRMAREAFPPWWGVQWNHTFHQLANLDFLKTDWQDHALYQYESRGQLLDDLKTLLVLLPETNLELKDWFTGKEKKKAAFVHTLRAHIFKRVDHDVLPRSAVDPWGLAITSRKSIAREAMRTPTVKAISRQLQADHYDTYFKAIRKYTGGLNTFFRQAAEGIYALSQLHTSRNEELRFRQRNEGLLRSLRLSSVNLNDALEALPAMQQSFRAAFAHLFDDRLSQLEQAEQQTLRELALVWPDFARLPKPGQHGGIQTRSADVIRRYRVRLERELQRLRNSGIDVQQLLSDEQWEEQNSTIWLTVEVQTLRTIYSAHESVVQSLSKILKPMDQATWALDIIGREWSTIVIVPTRHGRAISRLTWVHHPSMLRSLDRYFWRQQPTEVPSDQLARLGLDPYNIALDSWGLETLEKTLLCYQEAQRSTGIQALLQMTDLPDEIRDELREHLSASQQLHSQAVREAIQLGLERPLTDSDSQFVEAALDPKADSWIGGSPELAVKLFGKQPEAHENYFANIGALLAGLDSLVLDAIDDRIEAIQGAAKLSGKPLIDMEQPV